MTIVHVGLGLTVLALNFASGIGAFLRDGLERLAGLTAGAHVLLGVQVATGFLLFSADGPGGAHVLLPVAALGVVVAVRVGRGEHHPREVLLASWAPVAAGAFSLASGLAH